MAPYRLSWMLGALNGRRSMETLHTHILYSKNEGVVFVGPKDSIPSVGNEAESAVRLDLFSINYMIAHVSLRIPCQTVKLVLYKSNVFA